MPILPILVPECVYIRRHARVCAMGKRSQINFCEKNLFCLIIAKSILLLLLLHFITLVMLLFFAIFANTAHPSCGPSTTSERIVCVWVWLWVLHYIFALCLLFLGNNNKPTYQSWVLSMRHKIEWSRTYWPNPQHPCVDWMDSIAIESPMEVANHWKQFLLRTLFKKNVVGERTRSKVWWETIETRHTTITVSLSQIHSLNGLTP